MNIQSHYIAHRNAECRVSNAECRVSNAECRVPNGECRVPNGECRGSNAECRVPNGEWISSQSVHSATSQAEGGPFSIQYSTLVIRHSAFVIRHPAFVIRPPALGIRHPALGIGLFLLLLIGLAPIQVAAQAWTMPKGEAYVKFFYGKVTAAEQYTFDGRASDYISGLAGDTFRDRSLYVYSEIGLTDRFSLVLSAPYKRTFVRDHAFRFRIFGFGTASIGGRFALNEFLGLSSSRSRLAVNLMAYVPTGYTRNYAPSAGAGQIDVLGNVFFGHSFHPFPAYAQVGAGYRHKSSWYVFSQAAPCRGGSDIHCIADGQPDFGDELQFHAEAGVSPLGRFLLLQAVATSVWSVEKPTIGFSALNPIPTHQRYLKVGAGVAVYPFFTFDSPLFNTLGLSVQYFETPYGRNTINSRDLFVGIEMRPRFF